MSNKTRKPTIVVEYYRARPRVLVPPALAKHVAVKFVDMIAKESHVLTYEGVSIYTLIQEEVTEFAFRYTDRRFAVKSGVTFDYDTDRGFTLRDLAFIPKNKKRKYARLFPNELKLQRLAYAIDRGHITTGGENKDMRPGDDKR